jgi:hypothetical protein
MALYTQLDDDTAIIVHLPKERDTESPVGSLIEQALPDRIKRTQTMVIQLFREPSGGWRTKSGQWYRTIEECAEVVAEQFGSGENADETERRHIRHWEDSKAVQAPERGLKDNAPF